MGAFTLAFAGFGAKFLKNNWHHLLIMGAWLPFSGLGRFLTRMLAIE
jgi:hypothetical protein